MTRNEHAFERFSLVVNGPALFQAIISAIELEVFDLIQESPRISLDAICRDTGLPFNQARVLMFSLCCTGLIERDKDGGYSMADFAKDYFQRDTNDSWIDILMGWHKVYYPALGDMTRSLKEGTNLGLEKYPGTAETLYERISDQPDLEVVFNKSMSAFSMRSMDDLVNNCDLSSYKKLLDVGGGDGTTASEILKQHGHLDITIFDFSGISTRDFVIEKNHLDTRISNITGNFFAQGFPAGFDAMLFSHVLEIYEPKAVSDLMKKAFEALEPGGKVMTYGFLSNEDETDGLYGARLALYLNVLAAGSGMAYPASTYEQCMHDAGFTDVHTVSGLSFEHGLTIGYKLA